jgi:protocatechuate 3,4-dioxygenase beta subunit
MKKLLLVGALLISSLLSSFGQGLGFNYQAMIRNADGEAIINQNVVMRIGIVQGSITGNVEYTETHAIESNAYGLVNLVVGTGTVVSGVFADIDWANGPFYIKVELDAESNGNYVTLGTTQLLSVPFANYAFSGGSGSTSWADSEESVSTTKKVGIGTTTPTSQLQVVANQSAKAGEPLFEIKNSGGNTVFAVYENEVKVFVDDTVTTPGGLTVHSRNDLGETKDLMVVGPNETTFYVEEPVTKESRGGFAITGRNNTKNTLEDLLLIKPTITEFFVETPVKESRGGFAITGRNNTKATFELMNITPEYTRFTVEESITKESRGGFAITGRNNTKETGLYDIFTVQPERTEIYVKNNPLKEGIPGFSIFGLDDQFNTGELFSVTEHGAVVNGSMAVAPDVETGNIEGVTQTEALVSGAVTDSSGSPIVQVGIIYNKSGLLNTGLDFSNSFEAGMVTVNPSFANAFTASLTGLNAETTYQVRAFAINQDGATGYGDIKIFTTDSAFNVTFNILTPDEMPIPDATVSILEQYSETVLITNNPGDYSFQLAMGTYQLEAIADGYYYKGEIGVEFDGQTQLIYTYEARKLTMNISDNLGNLVTDAFVSLENGGQAFTETSPNSEGVAIAYLQPGPWNYTIYSNQGHVDYVGALTMPSATDLVENVVLTALPRYTVTVTVLDLSSGNPLPGATVILEQGYKKGETKSYSEILITGADGIVQFTDVPEGIGYQVTVQYPDMQDGYQYFDLFQNEEITINMGGVKKE